MSNFGFYALVFRQKYIRRWGLMRNSSVETLSEHACEVAVVAHALALIGNRYFGKNYDADRAAAIALFHDVPEVYTGDMPTPVKYFDDDMKNGYQKVEERAVNTLLEKLPPELRPDYRAIFDGDDELRPLIKAADKLCAYIKCMEEERSGNRDFESAKKKTYEKLVSQKCEELDYFTKYILPSFDMNLDEIK